MWVQLVLERVREEKSLLSTTLKLDTVVKHVAHMACQHSFRSQLKLPKYTQSTGPIMRKFQDLAKCFGLAVKLYTYPQALRVRTSFVGALKTRNWTMEFLNKKWFKINDEVACKKILRCNNKALMTDLGKYLDKVEFKWFNRITGP
jgi:hypothetical protein